MQDADDAFDAVEHFEILRVYRAFVTDDADDGALFAAREVRFKAERFDLFEHAVDLGIARVMFHDDNHGSLLLELFFVRHIRGGI